MFRKNDRGFAPLIGVITLLIGVVVVLAIGSVVLTQINTSTVTAINLSGNTSASAIKDGYSNWLMFTSLSTNWVLIGGLVLLSCLAIVGFFIIRLFGGDGE